MKQEEYNIMKQLIEKAKENFERRRAYHRLSYNEKRIKDAEAEMLYSYSRWQSLLAANEASLKAKEEIGMMVQEAYQKFGVQL